MYLQLSGYFLRTLTIEWKENIQKLNNPELASNFEYNDALGIFSIFGILEYDGKNGHGETYDVFGKANISNFSMISLVTSFTATYRTHEIMYYLQDISRILNRLDQNDLLIIRAQYIQDIFYPKEEYIDVLHGHYQSLNERIPRNKAMIIAKLLKTKPEIPKEFLDLSNGW